MKEWKKEKKLKLLWDIMSVSSCVSFYFSLKLKNYKPLNCKILHDIIFKKMANLAFPVVSLLPFSSFLKSDPIFRNFTKRNYSNIFFRIFASNGFQSEIIKWSTRTLQWVQHSTAKEGRVAFAYSSRYDWEIEKK